MSVRDISFFNWLTKFTGVKKSNPAKDIFFRK